MHPTQLDNLDSLILELRQSTTPLPIPTLHSYPLWNLWLARLNYHGLVESVQKWHRIPLAREMELVECVWKQRGLSVDLSTGYEEAVVGSVQEVGAVVEDVVEDYVAQFSGEGE
jgi:hypothetical protein